MQDKLELILSKNKFTNKENSDDTKNMIYFMKKENQIEHLQSRLSKSIFLEIVEENYNLIVTDDSVENPFLISSELVRTIKDYTKNAKNNLTKAKVIFDWVEQNIKYGEKKSVNGYRNSKEVLLLREGVCGEMAYLYITMARSLGLKSNYVSVFVDEHGENVNHGCASVFVGRTILVDPAYHTFDIKHQSYEIINDRKATDMYQYWRYNG